MAMVEIEHIGIYQIEPSHLFIQSEVVAVHTLVSHLPQHALVGSKIVKSPHTYLMSDR